MERHKRKNCLLALVLSLLILAGFIPGAIIAEGMDGADGGPSYSDESLPQESSDEALPLETSQEDAEEGDSLEAPEASTEAPETNTEAPEASTAAPDPVESEEPDVTEAAPPPVGTANTVEPAPAPEKGEENPDHLEELDSSPEGGEIDYHSYPETDFALPSPRRLTRGGVRANDPPIIGTDHPSQPGEVMLFKESSPVAGMVNTWDVTLRIEGVDTQKTSDIILIIDTSGSMLGTRLDAAKAAAIDFIEQLLPSDTTRIGVVGFASSVYVVQDLTNDADALRTSISALKAIGGTFTQAGIKQADALLANTSADNKHMVLLSDGLPTYSYAIPNDDIRRAGYVEQGSLLVTGTGYDSSAYGSERVGTGSHLTSFCETYQNKDCRYHNGNSAIAQAGSAKNAGQRVWSIALEVNETGQDILERIASPDSYYTASPDDLAAIYVDIAGQIARACENAQISDPMGMGFVIPAAEVANISTVPATPAASYDPDTKKITWNPGTLTTPIEEGSNIKYAQLTYRIEINDDILDQTPEGDYYSTNGEATLSFTNAVGQTETRNFPVPKVDPILLVVEKVLYDSHGVPVTDDPYDRVFTVEVNGLSEGISWPEPYHQIFELRAGEKKIMTNLRLEDTYTVTETGVTYSGSPGDLGDYETNINVYGIDQATFQIRQGNPDSPVLVSNSEKPLGEILVYKKFEPLELLLMSASRTGGTPSSAAPVFNFVLLYQDGTGKEFTLKAGEYKLFENLPYGEYIVTEPDSQGFEVEYYDTDPTNGDYYDGRVTLTILEKEDEVTVVNRPRDDDMTVDIVGRKVWSGGPEADHVAVQMYLWRNGAILVSQPDYTVSPSSGTATEFTYTWEGLQKYDDNGVPYVYTINEGPAPDKYVKTVDDETLTVTNTFQPDMLERIEAEKIWRNGPTPRPTIYFELFRIIAGGVAEAVPGAEVKELRDGTTRVEWLNLPAEDNNGNPYFYYVVEKLSADGEPASPENYELDNEQPLTLINSYVIPRDSVTATKTWINGPQVHPEIWFKLYRSLEDEQTEEVPGAELKHLPDGTTEVVWEDIELTDINGNAYTFRVKEVDALGDDYVPEHYEKTEDGLTVTNSFVPPVDDFFVIKVWEDTPTDPHYIHPAVSIQLEYKTTADANWQVYPIPGELDGEKEVLAPDSCGEAEDWIFQWTNVPLTDLDGIPYEFRVVETAVPDNFVVTYDFWKDFTVINTWQTVDISGFKTWDDAGDQDRMRPESITIRVRGGGLEYSKVVTAADGWAWNFTQMPKFKDGELITYTVSEDPVPGYTSEVSGYNVTNTHVPGSIRVPVKKVWEDENNADKVRPDSVTIRLLVDGVYKGTSLVLSEKNGWSATFDNLPEYADGKKLIYTVDELPVDKYTAKITGDAQNGFVVTNCHEPVKDTPRTGRDGINPWLGLALLAAAAGILLIVRRRKA